MGLRDPSKQCDLEFSASQAISGPLKDSILRQNLDIYFECRSAQLNAKSFIKQQWREQAKQAADNLKQSLSPANRKVLDLASEKGASN